MADGTHIEWTDATWNVINGCTVLSPGCTNCYAMRLAGTRLRNSPSREGLTKTVNGNPVWTGEVLFNRRVALEPFQWETPRRIFVCAHGDLFHEKVPEEWIDYVFMVALLNPRHTFQILTKRTERMRDYMREVLDEPEHVTAARFANAMHHGGKQDTPADQVDIHWPPRNVWLGTSVEDQRRADERIPLLLETPAAVRWLSCEPLLGPVDLDEWFVCPNWSDDIPMDMTTGLRECCAKCDFTGIAGFEGLPLVDWVVVGGESGPNSRPMHPAWAISLRDQCVQAGVAFHFKQWGDWLPFTQCRTKEQREAVSRTTIESNRTGNGKQTVFGAWSNGHKVYGTPGIQPIQINRVGKKIAGREIDGREWNEYPEVAA
jgi:protein gp37